MNTGAKIGLALACLGAALCVVSIIGLHNSRVEAYEEPKVEETWPKYAEAKYIELWTDPETGCKYVRKDSSGTSFVVRVKPDGKPLCEEKP